MSIEGIIVGLLAIVIGLAWAFYGLKLFTILLPIWAFFFGLVAGAQWGQDVFGQSVLLDRPVVGHRPGLRARPRRDLVLLVLRRDRHPRRRRRLLAGRRLLRVLRFRDRRHRVARRADPRRASSRSGRSCSVCRSCW